MPTIVDLGICLRHWDWSETSQTLALFTREHGLIRGLAKGSRRPRSRFCGGVETMTLGQVTAVIKPTGVLANVTAWDLREMYPGLRRSLRGFHGAMYSAEVALRMVVENDPHPVIFDALDVALRGLSAGGGEEAAVLEFQWRVLVDVGYRPSLGAGSGGGVGLFDPERGGVNPAGGGLGWRVRPETLSVLEGLEAGDGVAGGEQAIARASRLLGAYLRHLAGREFAAAAGFFGPAGGSVK